MLGRLYTCVYAYCQWLVLWLYALFVKLHLIRRRLLLAVVSQLVLLYVEVPNRCYRFKISVGLW